MKSVDIAQDLVLPVHVRDTEAAEIILPDTTMERRFSLKTNEKEKEPIERLGEEMHTETETVGDTLQSLMIGNMTQGLVDENGHPIHMIVNVTFQVGVKAVIDDGLQITQIDPYAKKIEDLTVHTVVIMDTIGVEDVTLDSLEAEVGIRIAQTGMAIAIDHRTDTMIDITENMTMGILDGALDIPDDLLAGIEIKVRMLVLEMVLKDIARIVHIRLQGGQAEKEIMIALEQTVEDLRKEADREAEIHITIIGAVHHKKRLAITVNKDNSRLFE